MSHTVELTCSACAIGRANAAERVGMGKALGVGITVSKPGFPTQTRIHPAWQTGKGSCQPFGTFDFQRKEIKMSWAHGFVI